MQTNFLRHGLIRPSRADVTISCLLITFVVCGMMFLPLISEASRQEIEGSHPTLKRLDYVPGEVLVRFRQESSAVKLTGQEHAQTVLSIAVEGRQIPLHVERLSSGSEIVPGLRLARVDPIDTTRAIQLLNARPDVVYAEPNFILHRQQLPNDPRFNEQWGLRYTRTPTADIDAEQAWDITTGSRSVVVGVVDEGIDINHEDLSANIWTNPGETPGNGVDDDGNGLIDDLHGWDFLHNDSTVYDGPGTNPDDSQIDAHGTHVAGIIGAVGNNGTGIAGVNWQVTLLPLKFLGPNGGSTSDSIRAYDYARNLKQAWDSSGGTRGANVRILNNSYGGVRNSLAALDAIRALSDGGILFVAAAGNEARDNDRFPVYPANYNVPNLVSVGSADSDSLPSSGFSNYGQRTVDLLAPGSLILSTVPNNSYQKFSGTSAAAPHATGSAALVCAAFSNISMRRLRAALVYGGAAGISQVTSSGKRVSARGSLDNAAETDPTAPAAVGSFQATSLGNQRYSLQWIAPGDDGTTNDKVSFYEVRYSDNDLSSPALFEQAFRLLAPTPESPGTTQRVNVTVPFRHPAGFIGVRALDNVGNSGPISVQPVNADIAVADPYLVASSGPAEPLTTGGTPLNLVADDRYTTYQLPFDFTFFGVVQRGIVVSTNGTLQFTFPSQLPNGQPDVDISGTDYLMGRNMIAGLWDDLRTDRRSGDDVYVVTPDPTKVIFRWQAVTYNTELTPGNERGENPVNFEIELRRDGTMVIRYGEGNHNLLPVVGASAGEPDPYLVETHSSEFALKDLALAPTVTFTPRRPTPMPTPDLSVIIHASPDQPAAGQPFTYIVDAFNGSNSQSSEQTTVVNQLPAGATFISCTTTRGSCVGPAVDSTGTVTAQLGTLIPNLSSSAQITITVKVTAAVGSILMNTATISGYWQDLNPINNTASISSEVRAPALFGNVVQLSAGGGGSFNGGHTLALKSDGRVWAWGMNYSGQVGDGTSSNLVNTPVMVVGLSNVAAIDAGGSHSLALKTDGTVWAWGDNNSGQAGARDPFTPMKPRATQVAGLSGTFTAIASGSAHSLALRSDGTVWSWGSNTWGELGNGTITQSEYSPVQVIGLNNVIAVAAGGGFSLALKADGTVWGWGLNAYRVLGFPGVSFNTPVQISELSNVKTISAGGAHALALKNDGTVWAWGDNQVGQLGSGEGSGSFAAPRRVTGLSDVSVISAGYQHNLALLSNGSVWSWGANPDGQLGDGTTITRNIPVSVGALHATSVTAAHSHSGALLADGSLRMWGNNASGQLGDQTNVSRSFSVEVIGSYGVPAPTILPDGGAFNNPQGVTIGCGVQGAIIYYTLDGTEPTTDSPAVSNGSTVVVSHTLTLKAKAFKLGWPDSVVKTASFAINVPAPTPIPTPVPGATGQPIAFTRAVANGNDIFLMNLDGSGAINLTNSPGADMQPAWAPNGTQLAFTTHRTTDGLDHIALMQPDGTNLRVIEHFRGTSDSSPSFSPDGTRIAYVSTFPATGLSRITIMDLDGAANYGQTSTFSIASSPAWSPDGTKIAYAHAFLQQNSEIVVAPSNQLGVIPNPLTNNPADDITPSWSPDGTKIAFSSNRDTNYEIYLMNADGTNPQRLTNSPGADRFPAWSPDGTKIIFASERDGPSNAEIYVMNADGTNPVRLTNNTAADLTPSWRQRVPAQVQFSASSYRVSEGLGVAEISVTRTGDVSESLTVDYGTTDDSAPVRCDDNILNNGAAYARCDYATTIDTLTFGPGESSKTFFIPLIDDAYVENDEIVQLSLKNAAGAILGAPRNATLSISDNDAVIGANPIINSPFFVRQQYLDFLSREPEPSGFNAWLAVLNNCSDVNNNPACDRNTVSSSFFRSQEFQLKGYFVYKFYRLTLNRLPAYTEIASDMRKVTGQTSNEVFAKRDAFTRAWIQRQDFKDRFDNLNDSDFLDRLMRNVGLEQLSGSVTRDTLRDDLIAGRNARADVLRALVEHADVDLSEYNGAFVAMQYYGYLRRTPEPAGYQSWLNYLNKNPTDFRTMVNGFVNSIEYRLRFGP